MFEQVQKTEQDMIEIKPIQTVFHETERFGENKEKIDLHFQDLSYSVSIKHKKSRCSFKHECDLLIFFSL